MRVIKGTAALVVLVAGLTGVPAFLLLVVGSPLPAELDPARWLTALMRPDDGSILIDLVTLIAWIAWLVFAVAVIAEVVAVLSRQRVQVRIPGLAAPQRLASGLVVAVISLAVVSPPAGLAEAATPLPALAPPQATPHGQQVPHERSSTADAIVHAAPTAGTATDAGVVYAVQRGDDLWSLGERFYGEGRAWRTIAAANPQLLSGGPDRLEPGWRLWIPDPAPAEPSGYLVEPGDTLSSVADRTLGSGDRWPEVFEANRFQLDDPDELPVGLRLVVPAPAAAGESLPTSAAPRDAPAPRSQEADAGGAAPQSREPDALPKPRMEASTPVEADQPVDATAEATTPDAEPTVPDDRAPGAEAAEAGAAAVDPVAAAVTGVGGLLAAAVISGALVRRRRQLQLRPVGRRLIPPSPAAQSLESHLERRQRPMGLRTLDLATRAIAAHCHRTGHPLPELATARVADDHLVLEMTEPGLHGPEGFTVDGFTWRLRAGDVHRLRTVPGLGAAVRPYPALVTLGLSGDGEQVVADLEALRMTSIDSPDPGTAEAALAALAVELTCSSWAEELDLVLIGTCELLPDAVGHHHVTYADELGPVLDRLERRAASQRTQSFARSVAARRTDPDRADPWVPAILLVNRPLSAPERGRLRRLVLTEPPVSIAVVGTHLSGAPCQVVVSGTGADATARIEPYGLDVTPQLLEAPAVAAVMDLLTATGRTDTAPAPWWFDAESEAEPDPPDNVTYLGRRFGGWTRVLTDDQDDHQQEGAVMEPQSRTSVNPSHPVLRLLGPVELDGAAGPVPSRAAKQCLEYCAWLLEHPGTTAQAMAAALAVAEGTRRSNMSRLRSWLGLDELDQPYLPDAYSGRILLHPTVSSDWQRLQILTSRGVNRTSSAGLEAALRLVRGAPLADAAPGQWHWAEGLRTDMVSVIRDIGVELAGRALEHSDIELARWAASRALTVSPGDELLLVARIKTEHRAGNDSEVERLTLQLASHARSLEVDLRSETVDVLQQMMEGRVRARLA